MQSFKDFFTEQENFNSDITYFFELNKHFKPKEHDGEYDSYAYVFAESKTLPKGVPEWSKNAVIGWDVVDDRNSDPGNLVGELEIMKMTKKAQQSHGSSTPYFVENIIVADNYQRMKIGFKMVELARKVLKTPDLNLGGMVSFPQGEGLFNYLNRI